MPAPLRTALALLAGLGAGFAIHPTTAQTLRIAMSGETTSADPHNYSLTPNTTLQQHVFEALTAVDADLKVQPGLATRWERLDDRTWVFHLRDGVRFHNGQSFGAPDVVFSYCRTLNNPGEVVQSFSRVTRRIAAMEAVDERTLRLVTKVPEPLLLNDLNRLAILPRALVGGAALDFGKGGDCGFGGPWPAAQQFNDASAAIGTGPFRLRSYTPGGAIELERNDDYWGDKPHWAQVRLTPVTAAGPRMAGLLAGDQDVIESPGTGDLAQLRQKPGFTLANKPTTRLIFIQLDTARSPSPFVQGGEGRNPLQDVRVRQALSLAIDRQAVEQRVMDGVATPAAQYLPDGMTGTIPGLPVLPYDPARAKRLLAEAGHKDGFAMTFHATNNRYINDARLAQVLAQFWNRIGVKVELDAMPSSVFFGRRGKKEFSVAMGGWSADADETLMFFRSWLLTTDRAQGVGTSNYGGWSNARFDELTGRAMQTMDPAARDELLRQASQVAVEEMPVIPVQFENAVWAMRKGLAYGGRMDQTTDAAAIRPAE
ncbi:ABC transporter substrate-binding protein [Teichococcus vastitatis]|uniref:ABC transporter substrate-binding protein n=1 Tax=Teichococcus vastitatis TaxID=2307076 RepID=A0ABS9WCS0_9PROT|nr:ABC transporter substrate-binding protein [Pseudoroseomonas vastitatis]MCI0756788.1 ABC transporter substrate-binding protein [Pseudoroseomonas vastitatis]